MKLSTMITKRSVTVNFDGSTHTVPASDSAYALMVEAIRAGNHDEIRNLVSKAARVASVGNATSDGNFEVRDGVIFIDRQEVVGDLSKQILEFMNEKLPFQPLVNFCRKVRCNPSFRAVNALFSFLEKNQHPVTENGNFIAYKRVRPANDKGEMLDIHSGTFDNRPGRVLEMPRNQVNEDPTVTCSHGLHVANWDYAANHFGGPGDVMLEVEVDPADVVAIPTDYNESKMRVCRYTVRSVVANPNTNKHLVTDSSNDPEEELDEDDLEDEDLEEEEDEDEDDCPFDECSCQTHEDDDKNEPAAPSPAGGSVAPVQLHDEYSLRKMATARLRNYQKRLTASFATMPHSQVAAARATLAKVNEVLKSR